MSLEGGQHVQPNISPARWIETRGEDLAPRGGVGPAMRCRSGLSTGDRASSLCCRAWGASVDIQLQHRQLEERIEEVESYLAALQGEFREKGIKGRTSVGEGPIVEAIISVAEREGADLIALASHGRTGLSQVFYGSVAAGVLHRVDRPLLLVRSQDQT